MKTFETYHNEHEEMQEFFRHLYHDKKNGQVIQLRKDGKKATQHSVFDVSELAGTGTDQAHYYVTVNSFRGQTRTADRVFNFCSIFIDLDCHADDPARVEDAKKRAVEILEKAYDMGKLARPTLITDTGRGFGIQYVLQKSIANIPQTEGQRDFFKRVRKGILEKYQEILEQDPLAAQPDPTVLDDARVCRVPGTYNMSAGRYCRLICAVERYFELSDLVKECHLWVWVDDVAYQEKKKEREERKREAAKRVVIPFAEYRLPFLKNRIDQLMLIQDMRGKSCTDACREQLLFIAYSAFVQLDSLSAADKLQELNARFVDPLNQSELDHIIEETNSNVYGDYSGYYKLSNAYVIQTLALTEAEIKAVGIGNGWKRKVERMAAKKEKEQKKEKVIELLKKGTTYEEIAMMTGVSKRSVCSIAKAEGLMRYAKAAQRHVAEDAESAKSATKSVCVVFPQNFVQPSLLSTSLAHAVPPTLEHTVTTICSDSAVKFLDPDKILSVLIGYASNLLGLSLLRLYNTCMMVDSLKPAVIAHLRVSLPTYNTADITAFYKALSADMDYLARLLVSVQRPSGWSDTESSTERKHRLDYYLHLYKDERFDILTGTPEYLYRLDYDVLKSVKMAFMQVRRLRREFILIENQQIPIKDIQECFDSFTYKDIMIICERIAHKGTIQKLKKTFFYIVQVAYKYKHPELAKKQEERIAEQKLSVASNAFCNFEQRNIDFGLIEANAVRELLGQPLLSEKEYRELMQIGTAS